MFLNGRLINDKIKKKYNLNYSSNKNVRCTSLVWYHRTETGVCVTRCKKKKKRTPKTLAVREASSDCGTISLELIEAMLCCIAASLCTFCNCDVKMCGLTAVVILPKSLKRIIFQFALNLNFWTSTNCPTANTLSASLSCARTKINT